MRIFKTIVYLMLFTIVTNSCIEPFIPDIEDNNAMLVINGTLTNEEGFQYAQVSRTSSYNEQTYKPVNDCNAKIVDGKGNVFEMEKYSEGKYKTWIDQQYLETGNMFKIEVTLENGKKYVSDYDTLLVCPEIDSIYYEKKIIESDDPLLSSNEGIQFYIDFDASGEYARNYRWELVETWEYHSSFQYIKAYYFNMFCDQNTNCLYNVPNYVVLQVPHDSLYKCWKTHKLKDIYTYSTYQKRDSKVNALPLNVTLNIENRLAWKYSILVKQYTLSHVAFNYWNHLQEQSNESGGLYESQPYWIKGNIKSIDDENETVLGIFSVSTVKTKRFINFFYFPVVPDCLCMSEIISDQDELDEFLGKTDTEDSNPIYLMYNGELAEEKYHYYEQSCFDCRLKGGINRKPDYW